MLFLDDSGQNVPEVFAGSNGLILVRGRIAELAGSGAAGTGTSGAGTAGGGAADTGTAGAGTADTVTAGAGTAGADAKSYTVRDTKELCFIDAVSEKVTFAADILPESKSFKPVFAHEKHLCAAAYDDGTVFIYDADGAEAGDAEAGDSSAAGSAAAGTIVHKYNADEVSNLCFSDDDAYLLVLTFAGQLDVYEVDGTADGAPVYSEKIDVFRENSSLLSSRTLTAKTVKDSDLLFVSVYNSCLVLEKGYWAEISEFECTSPVYDPVTGRVYFKISNYTDSAYSSSDIISYPVYDIEKLSEWAKSEAK